MGHTLHRHAWTIGRLLQTSDIVRHPRNFVQRMNFLSEHNRYDRMRTFDFVSCELMRLARAISRHGSREI